MNLQGILRAWRGLLVLGPVLVIAIAFQSLWSLHEAGEKGKPDEMSVETERLARLIDSYLSRVVGVTAFLAVSPDVVRLADKESRIGITATDKRNAENWPALANLGSSDPFDTIRKNPLSVYFADLKNSVGSAYREIFLCDVQGQVIAASNRTENYLQSDDLWWPKFLKPKEPGTAPDRKVQSAEQAEAERIDLLRCRHIPMECVHIGGIEWDPSAGLFGYDIVLPVVDAQGRAVGVLKAVIDPKELEGLLGFAASNRKIDMALLDAEGARLFSREPFFEQKSVPRLRDLAPGAEASWALGKSRKKGPVAFVRRLASPVADGWFIALADRGSQDGNEWGLYALWCVFTLGMFVVAAGAFAVRGEAS